MTASPVTVPVNPLSRDIDVSVTITRPQTELQTDLSLLCFVTDDLPFPPNNDRVRVYSTFDSVIQDTGWVPEDTGYFAAQAFFSQDARPTRMAIGRVFDSAVPSQLMGAVITDYASLAAVTEGSFIVTVYDANGVPAVVNVSGIDFSNVANVTGVATAIETAITAASQENVLTAGVSYGNRLVITARGTGVTISYAEAGIEGTDVSTLLNLTQVAGAQRWDGYTPTGLVGEIQLIASASRTNGFPAFAWALDRKWRDTPEQRQVSDWAETQNWKAWAVQCTNSPTAYDSGNTTNICYYAQNLAYRATSVQFSENVQYYPEIAYAAYALHVNYSLGDSTVTNFGKDLVGIPLENVTETQVVVLDSRNCNVFTKTGNTARVVRYGKQSAPSWYTDSYLGACNFREALQVNVANVLYRNKKVPYNTRGQTMIISAIAKACSDYEYNGFISDRDVLDLTNENGYSTLRAYKIEPTPIYRATETQRAQRILPPIQITLYEAGAIHHVVLFVDLVN